MYFRHRGFHRHRHRHGHRFGPWVWEGRFFEKGELPLAILSLLEDGPKHGYELMKNLEQRLGGIYQASAGTTYPTLQQLQDQELVTSRSADGGKRVYELTKSGRDLLEEKAEALRSMWQRADEEEWGGWRQAHDERASEIMRPAFRLMRTAMCSVVDSDDPEHVDRVRDILRRTRHEIRDLRPKGSSRKGEIT